MKTGKWIAFGLSMLCAALWGAYTLITLVNGSLLGSGSNAIGVIGGPDGPTAVYTAYSLGDARLGFLILALLFAVSLTVWLVLRHMSKKRG